MVFLLTVGHIFLLLRMSGSFDWMLDIVTSPFGCWVCLYPEGHSWPRAGGVSWQHSELLCLVGGRGRAGAEQCSAQRCPSPETALSERAPEAHVDGEGSSLSAGKGRLSPASERHALCPLILPGGSCSSFGQFPHTNALMGLRLNTEGPLKTSRTVCPCRCPSLTGAWRLIPAWPLASELRASMSL